ncbi:MAG TPA: amidohydrolase, partial [Rhizobiales bacterium]|nr:amidohydrolase [Hyphomicrobiales bacterium]
QIKPVFTHLAEHLGPEHLLWGSDWPHTRFEAKQCFADSVSWMAGM